MSRFLRSVRLALHPAQTINQRFLSPNIYPGYRSWGFRRQKRVRIDQLRYPGLMFRGDSVYFRKIEKMCDYERLLYPRTKTFSASARSFSRNAASGLTLRTAASTLRSILPCLTAIILAHTQKMFSFAGITRISRFQKINPASRLIPVDFIAKFRIVWILRSGPARRLISI